MYGQETIFTSTVFVEADRLYNSAQQRAQQTYWPCALQDRLSLVDAAYYLEVGEAD